MLLTGECMSLANDVPFPEGADVLLRYGVLRQQSGPLNAAFCACLPVPAVALPSIGKPGTWVHFAGAAGLIDRVGLLAAQRQQPWVNQFLWELTSGTFTRTLEILTGCHGLLPDAAFCAGGWCRGQDFPAVKTVHTAWRLPAALVLDVLVSDPARQGLSIRFGQGDGITVQEEGEAIVWKVCEPVRLPGYEISEQARVLRLVYFYGLGDRQ